MSNWETDILPSDAIQEVSEPASPPVEPPLHSWKSPGPSALTDMFRRTTQTESSPSTEEYSDLDIDDINSHSRIRTDMDAEQGPQDVDSNLTNDHATERTPLISRVPTSGNHARLHQGQQDLEGQGPSGIKSSWPRMRKIILWPREKACALASSVTNPKRWDRTAIWRNVVVAPISCLPAVALGLLLNILDALSYGGPQPISTFFILLT